MEVASIDTHPDMVWVGEGWLIVRGSRDEVVAEYLENRNRAC